MISSRMRWIAAAALCCGVSSAQAVRTVLPNGREIRPLGTWVPLAPYPFAIAIRADGKEATIPSVGFPFALNVVTLDHEPTVKRLPAVPADVQSVETHAGVAYSPDGQTAYVATGNSGKVAIWHTQNWTRTGEIALDGITAGKDFAGSFAATVVVSNDGRWLYALDQGNWRVVAIDLEKGERTGWAETGTYPFGLALSPDAQRLYVTNTGLFEYKALASKAGLKFPPFGWPSQQARNGTRAEGISIPGLGDDNTTRGSSLWTYTLSDHGKLAVATKLHLGHRIAARGNVGGAAPTGVVAGPDAVYVALSHEDAVVKVNPDGSKQLAEVALTPFSQFKNLRGVIPSGLALRDGRLYVAESGINAVAIVDAATMHVAAHLPVGWNPSAVAVSPDGATLYVVNAKGRGTGANAGPAHDAKGPTYIGALEYGSLSIISLPSLPAAQTLTQTLTADVLAANLAAVVNKPAMPRLKHCFLVIRENRTFDEVLGDLPGANGDPSLARFGMSGWAEENKAATALHVTPNLHALAAQFATSDNFYVDSDVSADGHRWVMGINPTPFFNTAWTSNYGGRRKEDIAAAQPGRRAMFGGADAPMPEDEPQFGSLWEHVAASGLGILNYGEGLELEGSDEADGLAPQGQRLRLNSPLPLPVFEHTDRRFPTFNLGLPDQLRADEFERDLRRRIAAGKVPGLIVIRLPNDHTATIRPADGYPYRASFVADNDLALGRIVSFLSKTTLWKDSALFVTEDDAQGGVDHVDAHRSLLLVASPWVKPGLVAHGHLSMGSITRTIDELLGLPPLNLEDALAGEMTGIFDTVHHDAPYTVHPSDPRVFDPAKARIARPRTKIEAAALRRMDDAREIESQVESSPHP